MVDKWFSKEIWRIVSITILLVAAALLLVPALGFAQGEQESNWSESAPDVGTLLGRTDDPLGRVEIPAAVQDSPVSNTDPLGAVLDRVGMLSGDEAAAREGEIRSYSSPLVIPGADFSSDGLNPDSYFFWFYGGRIEGGEANTCLMAPAYLPNGVIVSNMFVSFVDNNPGSYLYVRLFRVDNYDGSVDIMADFSTTIEQANPSLMTGADTLIDYPFVTYPTYSYYVGTCLTSSGLQLYSVRLYYGQ